MGTKAGDDNALIRRDLSFVGDAAGKYEQRYGAVGPRGRADCNTSSAGRDRTGIGDAAGKAGQHDRPAVEGGVAHCNRRFDSGRRRIKNGAGKFRDIENLKPKLAPNRSGGIVDWGR